MATSRPSFSEEEVPSTDPVILWIDPDSRLPATTTKPDEFNQVDKVPAPPKDASSPVGLAQPRRLSAKGATQMFGAFLILGGVGLLYLLSLIGLMAGLLDIDEYSKTAIVFAGPLSLGSAVTAFLYGQNKANKT